MILLTLSRGKGEETVRLQLPASPAEIGEAFASLDRISLDTTATAILDVSSNVPVLYRCLYDVDVEDSEQFQKLQKLAERTEALSPAKAAIFSGALDAECVWNLEGALTVADRLDEYTLDGIKSKTVGDGQHGTARWATKQEIRQTYAHVPFEPELWRKGEHLPEKQGLVLCCEGPKDHVTALVDTDDIHAMVTAASGAGKTAFFLYPNIEYALASGMSFLCTDTKGDLFRNYAGIAKDCYGYQIAVLDLRNPTRSDGNNLLHLINKYMDTSNSRTQYRPAGWIYTTVPGTPFGFPSLPGTSNVAGFTVMRSPSLIIIPPLLSLDLSGGCRNSYGHVGDENTVAPALHNVADNKA